VKLKSDKLLDLHNEHWNKLTKDPSIHEKSFKMLGTLESEGIASDENDKPYQNIFSEFDKTIADIQEVTRLDMLKLSSVVFDSMSYRYDDYKTFVTMFALHDEEEMAYFKHWWTFWDFPIEKIREYFGEQLGFYFAFSCHSVVWYA
jgi:hypothetical protein